MNRSLPRLSGLLCMSALGLVCASGAAAADPDPDTGPATVLITAQRADRVSTGATGLNLDIRETPQSISVVTQQQMEQLGVHDINDALRLAPGINVEEWETNRTNYMARGFEIRNTQIDGVGLPNDWGIVTGAMDSFGYEKLEVIRGANGLLTGVGNASGTINYVRKRPTNDAQGTVSVSGGSWGDTRIEADYSTPLVRDGGWAGRLVVAREDSGSYLRDLDNDRTYVYGVIDGQVGEHSTLTVGYSWQKADTTGNMWGALTFSNSDGSQAQFDRSASTTQDWTYWNTVNQSGFIELAHELSPDWRLTLTYNYRRISNDDQLFFAYAAAGLDPVTHEGLSGWPGKWWDVTTSHLGDITLSGRFTLFGREHQGMLGASNARSALDQYTNPVDPSDPGFGALPAFPYAGDVVPEPAWGRRILDNTLNQQLTRVFGATRLLLTDRLKAVAGFNYARYGRDGLTSGTHEPFAQTEHKVSPYAGLTYDITANVMGYVSYSDIYQPQDQYDINGRYLDPSKGVNYEVGVKADWLDRRLMTTLAWFSAGQQGLATYAGINAQGQYYYRGVDVKSRGYELEATGRLTDDVDVVFGVTTLRLTGDDGADIYPWVPRQVAKLTLSAHAPGYRPLSFGIGGRWQGHISANDGYSGLPVRQDAYGVLNAFVAWSFLPEATLRVNVGNVGDEKYINSLYQIGYYGAPRNYSAGLTFRF